MDIDTIINSGNINVDQIKNDLEHSDNELIHSKYINVVKHSNSNIGMRLSIGHPRRFESVIGTCGSVRNAIDCVRTNIYPKELLSISRLTKKQINRIPTKKRRVVNFISSVATLLYDSIVSDEQLITDIRSSEGEFISYNKHLRKSLGSDISVYEYNHTLSYYIKIVRMYVFMIRHDVFTPEYVIQVIERLKVDKSLSSFHGTDTSIK